MGQLAKLVVIVSAIAVQVVTANSPASWLYWVLYALLALIAAGLFDPTILPGVLASAPVHGGEGDRRPPPPALSLFRSLMILTAVAAVALATEWSAANRRPDLALAAWLLSGAALSAALWRLRVAPPRRAAAVASRGERLILLGLLLVALLLRTLWLDALPRVYFGDESRAGMWVRNAYQNGMPNLFTMGWNTWSMLGLSLQGMFGPWLGLNTVSLRLASAVFGTSAVLAVYLLARALFDRPTALLAAALLACNRTAIDFSRLGTTHAQVMLIETLAFFALWRAINTGSAVAYLWTGICAALCLHSYNAAHAVPVFLLGWLVVSVVVRPRAARPYLRGAALALVGFACVSLPWFYYLSDFYRFAHNWLQFTWMARARQVTPQLLDLFHEGGVSAALPLFAKQLWKTWLGFTVLPANAYQLGYPGGGMLDHVTAALFMLGLALAWRAGARGAFVLYWWGATAFTGGVLTIDPPAFVRLVGLVPALCILAALPLRSLLAGPTQSVWIGRAGAILLVVAAFADNWRTYFIEYGNSSAEEISELVHFVRELPPASPVYILGADTFLHFTHDVNVEQFVFDFPGRPFEDVVEPARFLPIRDPRPDVPTYLVLGPTQLSLAGYIRQLYPHSEVVDVTHRGNGRLFFRYIRLTPEDLALHAHSPLAHGLLASFERDGMVVKERIDPQLNFFTVETYFAGRGRLAIASPFRAHWKGGLRVEAPGSYAFEVIGGGPFTVDLGGERVCALAAVVPEDPQTCSFSRELQPGLVPIAVRWDAVKTPASVRMILQMYWIPPNGVRELIPPQHFVPKG